MRSFPVHGSDAFALVFVWLVFEAIFAWQKPQFLVQKHDADMTVPHHEYSVYIVYYYCLHIFVFFLSLGIIDVFYLLKIRP